jgi:hypothetical protein
MKSQRPQAACNALISRLKLLWNFQNPFPGEFEADMLQIKKIVKDNNKLWKIAR